MRATNPNTTAKINIPATVRLNAEMEIKQYLEKLKLIMIIMLGMNHNMLNLNDDKTEFIVFNSRLLIRTFRLMVQK